ncbi:hypothetical protein ACVWXU_000544 [Streptomyces sp. TE33382]
MIGSASTTTIAALDTGKELTWQSVTLTGIGFAITVAAMFTGYYKFRERSYFLQQTADAIEEEANAVRLGIGHYGEYGPGRADEAQKLFTQRVEAHRNEQRRRQQQLDQPADQATPSSQPPAGRPLPHPRDWRRPSSLCLDRTAVGGCPWLPCRCPLGSSFRRYRRQPTQRSSRTIWRSRWERSGRKRSLPATSVLLA